MSQRCTRCQRANPDEAVYCYFDGFVLSGHGGAGGPVAIGSQAFLNPFVFPSGTSCRSFNELALSCQNEWNSACDLLKQGYIESFLGSIGRIDLAMAAKEASKFPDKDRGLDQLLSKLPSDTLEDPKLRFEPQEVNLGILTGDQVPRLEIQLENQGMRLLYGSISTEAPWLVLGEGTASREKHFQFRNEQKIPIRINMEFLRAGAKPIEAKLVLETNGGSAVIHVKAERPIKPYPSGIFAGSKTPRQVAEKAKAQPKEVAPLFERGDVAEWYKSNGWTYPVQGPSASGMGAIQQFFEALGLTQPPKVDINVKSLRLGGKLGDLLTATIEVKTQEKRPVYAHGVSDQAWLVASRAKLNGRTATIDVTVIVPDSPGEELTARLTVQSNGKQRFVVPVKLKIEGERVAARRKPAVPTQPGFVLGADDGNPFAGMGSESPVEELVELSAATAVAEAPQQRRVAPGAATAVATAPETQVQTAPQSLGVGPARYRRKKETPLILHLLPAIVLVLAVAGIVIFDLVRPMARAGNGQGGLSPEEQKKADDEVARIEKENQERIAQQKAAELERTRDPFHLANLKDTTPYLNLNFNQRGSFGLTMTKEHDPNIKEKYKKLTYAEDGTGNNTIVKIDGSEFYFGRITKQNQWVYNQNKLKKAKPLPSPRHGGEWAMEFTDSQVEVVEHVELVAGATGLLDTCLVWYTVINKSNTTRTVGLRIMVDTYIGANDGVPFTIPGEKSFLTTRRLFPEKQVPEYVEAIESPDTPANLGTTARMQLKDIRLPNLDTENPNQLYIGGNPGEGAQWDDFLKPDEQKDIKDPKKPKELGDSVVIIYWNYQKMSPNTTRTFAFTYGLSEMVLSNSGEKEARPQDTIMALIAPASVKPDSEFSLSAYVWNGIKDQAVTINLPAGLELAPGEEAVKKLEAGGAERQLLTWKVRAKQAGSFLIETTTRKAGDKQEIKGKRDVKVTEKSIFG